MTHRRIRFRLQAKRALLDVYDYTQDTWSEAQAEKYIAKLRKAFERLLTFPALGAPVYPGSQIRKLVCEQHAAFYREVSEEIEIGCIFGPGEDFHLDLARYVDYVRREEE